MKLLFDQNLSFNLCKHLADVFPGSTQVRLLGMGESDDRSIWDHAASNDFILVSQDADFAEMAALFGPQPKVIWLRLRNRPTWVAEQTLRRAANVIQAFAEHPDAACLELYSSDET